MNQNSSCAFSIRRGLILQSLIRGWAFFPGFIFLATGIVGSPPAWAAPVVNEASYANSQAIKERFDQVTAKDMELLRKKKILFASRSYGLNLLKGLRALGKSDAKYQLVDTYEKFDVNKAGSDLSIIPPDVFQKTNFVHSICTQWPLTKRVDEIDELLRLPPHEFGKAVDIVVVFYDLSKPEAFDHYAATMDAFRVTYPKIRFIYVTAGLMGAQHAEANELSHSFSEKVRARYKGKVPLYDLGAIESDDFRCGHAFCPEYSQDPADLHPNLPLGEGMMAKGFLLVLSETFRQDPAALAAAASSLPHLTVSSASPAAKASPAAASATLPATHPDAKAVRALLDANGLKAKTLSSVSIVRDGRIAELFLQEGGMTEVTDDIGALTALKKLHLYGDRSLSLPLLHKISPAIARCTELQELLINQNDLNTLPVEITKLQKLRLLSLADNHLKDLPPAVLQWAQKFDPKGLTDQQAKP